MTDISRRSFLRGAAALGFVAVAAPAVAVASKLSTPAPLPDYFQTIDLKHPGNYTCSMHIKEVGGGWRRVVRTFRRDAPGEFRLSLRDAIEGKDGWVVDKTYWPANPTADAWFAQDSAECDIGDHAFYFNQVQLERGELAHRYVATSGSYVETPHTNLWPFSRGSDMHSRMVAHNLPRQRRGLR